jgi:valyl-tRNA synthetase
MKVGRRLAIKILNASRFALNLAPEDAEPAPLSAVTEPIDRAMLGRLADLVDDATAAFESYDYARALERTETFFWSFCDDHLELVKGRAYGAQGDGPAASAQASLDLALATLLKLFAPFLPYVTEEVWSWWQEGSIHRSSWPDAGEARAAAGDADPLVPMVAAEVLAEVRKAKTEAKRSLRTDVEQVVVRDTPERLAALALAVEDVKESGKVAELRTEETEALSVEVTLAPPED